MVLTTTHHGVEAAAFYNKAKKVIPPFLGNIGTITHIVFPDEKLAVVRIEREDKSIIYRYIERVGGMGGHIDMVAYRDPDLVLSPTRKRKFKEAKAYLNKLEQSENLV